MKISRNALLAALLALAAGCGSRPGGQVVAQVGPEEISASQLQQYMDRIPKGLRQGGTPVEVRRSVLESLIDLRLLLMEALATHIEEDPEFKSQMASASLGALLDLYQRRLINERIALTPEEIERYYRQTHRDRALRFSGIMLPTREEALKVIAELKAGADFHRLAAARSEHQETGERGGDSGGYKLRGQMSPAIAEAVAHLKVDEISQPVPVEFQRQTHFVVFKVLDEMPAPLSASESQIREDLTRQQRAARIEALQDSLYQVHAPQLHGEAIALVNRRSQQTSQGVPQFSAEEAQEAVCTFKGGQITIEDLMVTAQESHFSAHQFADSLTVTQILKRIAIPARLFEVEARSLGLDQDPQLLAKLDEKRQELSLEVLRQRDVDRLVQATAEDARAFYEANPAKFTSPETILATEILVSSDSLAQRLKQALQEGADPAQLARKYTQRQGAIHHHGQLRLNAFTQVFFQGIFEAAQRLEVGEVGGPVRVREGYSVFKVTDK
ncbi:MAG: peptidyl-prolyl cis-trans isomerase, partial [Candidatus Latescibacteria bacterium]|nr:peptidyl-prolyl cis-trans isomerase [Candidatus Latescibacterota bacterium]